MGFQRAAREWAWVCGGEGQSPAVVGRPVAAGALVSYVAERTMDRFHTSTSDLFWQDEAGTSGDYPGEHGASQRHWGEEKAGPRAGSWMASTEEKMWQHRAMDTPWGRCGVGVVRPPTSLSLGGSILARQDATEGGPYSEV
ncbi:hypothetical protein NDU88_006660 [Pleurodeles waltl]|uniref:Uncharacterized protein n=1 Tax=Pleurodeles waltl TaxID=8319 RepID=A0AAV7VMJ1_PLEWA|nr:hypothetical protein NDU88_006660 [Pleurodeles waltl]